MRKKIFCNLDSIHLLVHTIIMKYLVVGLGNPSEEYKSSRHNVGFTILDALNVLDNWNKSTTCNLLYKWDGEIEYIKPLTMMNLSGKAVACVMEKHNLASKDVIVVHDDIDLAFGSWKISFGSGDGGHNGIKSIIESVGTKDFIRIRVGIAPITIFGNKKRPADTSAFVLKNFPNSKIKEVQSMASDISKAIDIIAKSGVEKAMNTFN